MALEKIILRSDRKMFMHVPSSSSGSASFPELQYERLEGFSTLSESKNAQEYTRKYVDQKHETTTVTGISSSYDFTFDLHEPNSVLTDLAGIIDGEKIGSDAERDFVSVDFHRPVKENTDIIGYEAVKRTYSVIPSGVADGTDALTYSGTFRVKTKAIKGVATIELPASGDPDTVEVISFVANV